MTDVSASQAALVAPTVGTANAAVSQTAVVMVTTERAIDVSISQLAIVSVSVEYKLPLTYTGFHVPARWGNPLYVQK